MGGAAAAELASAEISFTEPQADVRGSSEACWIFGGREWGICAVPDDAQNWAEWRNVVDDALSAPSIEVRIPSSFSGRKLSRSRSGGSISPQSGGCGGPSSCLKAVQDDRRPVPVMPELPAYSPGTSSSRKDGNALTRLCQLGADREGLGADRPTAASCASRDFSCAHPVPFFLPVAYSHVLITNSLEST